MSQSGPGNEGGRVCEQYIRGSEALAAVEGTALFYPCSGNDLEVPIRLFSPFMTEFWFVDRGYFTPGHQNTKRYGFDRPADEVAPVLGGDADYNLLRKDIEGLPYWSKHSRDIEPCILTETYRHVPSGKSVKIKRRRGYGFSAFRNDIRKIGVFFYRGDSQGEGGSGNLWLNPKHVDEVCGKLVDDGLFVTDGSQRKRWMNSTSTGAYHQLSKYNFEKCPMSPEELVANTKSFADSKGRTFTCIGYAGERYGPTLIWRVNGASR